VTKRALFCRAMTGLALVALFGLPARPSAAQPADPMHDHNHGPTAEGTPAPTESGVAPLLGNLGSHQHPISTGTPLAQRYFDEGLILTFGFNHAEAIRSYSDAIKLDPACAICYWGIALALGPNINLPMDPAAVPDAWAALQRGLELAPGASPAERDYIQALTNRYSPDPAADRGALDLAYADAMRELSHKYPDDLDAASLFAEALMDLTPWQYWTKDGQPTTYTPEILSTLESVLARDPEHPAANHYYIHAVEASAQPERAIPSAERLATLVPGAGHLVHMPAHTFWRVGRYHDAELANEHAIHVDENYIPDRNVSGFYPIAYYPHNIHFLFAAAQMEGRSALAIDAARKLVSKVPEQAYRDFPPAEDYLPTPLFALVRFGKWDDLLQEPAPPADLRYTTGLWHWARGLAALRLGQIELARAEHDQHNVIAREPALGELTLASFAPATTNLQLASQILTGELAGASGQRDDQVSHLQQAVKLQDGLDYTEPPAWFYPVRQSLGAALLAAGRPTEAEAVYREDLSQYRENGWSLFGLAQSLRAQGKSAEADEVQRRFEAAWQYADLTLTSSRF
jgi:tetratricopeptide (TPR) repeat protein